MFFRFFLTGGIATIVQYLVLGIGTSFYGLSASFSTGIGYLLGSIVSYFMNYFFTFNSSISHLKATYKFYLMVCVGWLLSVALIYLLVDSLNFNKWISQIFTTGIVFVFNYIISKSFVFK